MPARVTVRTLPGQWTAALAAALVVVAAAGSSVGLVLRSSAAVDGIMIGGWPVATVLIWWGTFVRFETDHLVISRPWRRRRIQWPDVVEVTWAYTRGVGDSESERWAAVVVRRHPGSELAGDPPGRFGDYRRWQERNFRTIRLPVTFPEPPGPIHPHAPAPEPPQPRTRFGRNGLRKRETVRREFAARGHRFPEPG